MKILSIAGWVCIAIYASVVISLFVAGRNASGERAMGLIIPILMTPLVLLLAGALAWFQYKGWVAGAAVVVILLAAPLVAGPRASVRGLISLLYQ